MKNVVFIGNRKNVLLELLSRKANYDIKKIYTLENSPLHKHLKDGNIPYELFSNTKKSKLEITDFLTRVPFDLLVSNGCPFILSISTLKTTNSGALFINTHPSYLPHLKGKTPLNGVLYLGYEFIGATTHYMDDGIDTGNIIAQKKVPLTPDIDQGLIYFLSFYLEGVVFKNALKILEKNNFLYPGKVQKETGSYFNRDNELFGINLLKDSDDDIIRKVKSVGIINQGLNIEIMNKLYTVFEAEKIYNSYLLDLFKKAQPGFLLVEYSNKILIKTISGIIRFSYVRK